MTDEIKKFLRDCQLEGKAAGTLEEYQQRLLICQDYFWSIGKGLLDVKNTDIPGLKTYLFQTGKKSQRVKCILSTLSVFMKWADKNGLIDEVPVTPADFPQTIKKQRIRRLTDEELRIFTAYIDGLQENARAAFWLLIGTGARVGEAAHLKKTDVTLKGRSVYISIRGAKWGSDRDIPIVDQRAAKIVWKYRQSVAVDKQPLFRLSKRTIQKYATLFAKKTGITFRCHLLRHTFAARLTEKGVPITTIQYLLGHKSIAMTAYYAQSALADVSSITPAI